MSKEAEVTPHANEAELIAPVTTNPGDNVEVEKQAEDERFLDLSAHVLADHAYEYSDREARAVRRKIDLHLMPLMCSECSSFAISYSARCSCHFDCVRLPPVLYMYANPVWRVDSSAHAHRRTYS